MIRNSCGPEHVVGERPGAHDFADDGGVGMPLAQDFDGIDDGLGLAAFEEVVGDDDFVGGGPGVRGTDGGHAGAGDDLSGALVELPGVLAPLNLGAEGGGAEDDAEVGHDRVVAVVGVAAFGQKRDGRGLEMGVGPFDAEAAHFLVGRQGRGAANADPVHGLALERVEVALATGHRAVCFGCSHANSPRRAPSGEV